MKNYLKFVLHPELFHEGWLKPPFFEGWYFKLVNAEQSEAWAFIVGVFRQHEIEASHAFIQVLEGNTGKVQVFTYPYESFISDPSHFHIKVEENEFDLSGMRVHLQNEEIAISGKVAFGKGAGWPVHFFNPGIMGPFGWFNWMECYHGLLSFDHVLKGNILINQDVIDFSGGRGYIEKDFGKAFPFSWIWLQTNHFQKTGTSLSASIAVIPFLGLRFKGVIVGLHHEGKLIPFTTYDGAKVQSFSFSDDQVILELKRGIWRLELDAQRIGGGVLQAPVPSGMDRRITESLNAWVHVKLWKRNQLVFEDTGQRAGMEIVGDIALLRKLR